jgi:hypothetical protein
MTPGNPRGRAPADQRQALYVATVADDHASQRPAQNRRPDGLGLDLQRSENRDPMRGWTVALGVVWAPHANRGHVIAKSPSNSLDH